MPHPFTFSNTISQSSILQLREENFEKRIGYKEKKERKKRAEEKEKGRKMMKRYDVEEEKPLCKYKLGVNCVHDFMWTFVYKYVLTKT